MESIEFNGVMFYLIDEWPKYMVSKCGKVLSLKKGYPVLLKPNTDKNGYKTQTLTKNMTPKTLKIHRLVAMTFIPNINSYPVVNHINTIKDDNRVENLEWCTNKQNYHHSKNIHGFDFYNPLKWSGEKHGRSKLKPNDVLNIRKLSDRGVAISSISDAFKISYAQVKRIIKRENWDHI